MEDSTFLLWCDSMLMCRCIHSHYNHYVHLFMKILKMFQSYFKHLKHLQITFQQLASLEFNVSFAT